MSERLFWGKLLSNTYVYGDPYNLLCTYLSVDMAVTSGDGPHKLQNLEKLVTLLENNKTSSGKLIEDPILSATKIVGEIITKEGNLSKAYLSIIKSIEKSCDVFEHHNIQTPTICDHTKNVIKNFLVMPGMYFGKNQISTAFSFIRGFKSTYILINKRMPTFNNELDRIMALKNSEEENCYRLFLKNANLSQEIALLDFTAFLGLNGK